MAHPIMFDSGDPVLGRLRELCLAFPGAAEKISHGRPNFYTTKVFAVYGGGEKLRPGDHRDVRSALIFLPDSGDLPALDEEPRFFVPAYYGPSGWRALDLADPDTDWAEVAELLDASYRNTAPAKLVAQLDSQP